MYLGGEVQEGAEESERLVEDVLGVRKAAVRWRSDRIMIVVAVGRRVRAEVGPFILSDCGIYNLVKAKPHITQVAYLLITDS